MKFVFIFLVLFMTIGVNLPDGMLGRIGIDPSYLVVALAALVVTGLIAHRHLALAILVALMCIGANLPADYAANVGINRDILTAGLISLLVTPYVIHWFE